MSQDLLSTTDDAGITTVTINREARRNALSAAVVEGLTALFERAGDGDGTRTIVLTGAGDRAFCAGADLADQQGDGVLAMHEARSAFVALMLAMHRCRVPIIATAGRRIIDEARADGILYDLKKSGVRVFPDICWCSIREPVFPRETKVVLTNSGKYAHYGPGLSGRNVRLAGLDDCIRAALTGSAPPRMPDWLEK